MDQAVGLRVRERVARDSPALLAAGVRLNRQSLVSIEQSGNRIIQSRAHLVLSRARLVRSSRRLLDHIEKAGWSMPEPKCPRCGQGIAVGDTVELGVDDILHLDCRQPRSLSSEERVLLYWHCWSHAAAKCMGCGERFRPAQLGTDLSRNVSNLCPHCHRDLTESLRGHLYRCAMLPEEVRRRAREARDAARRLVKESSQSRALSDVLMREAEVAIDALRETMRRDVSGRRGTLNGRGTSAIP
jgi:hypothetical protein